MVVQKRVNIEALVTQKVNLDEFITLTLQSKSTSDFKVLIYPF
jgi:hypothetical protein